MILGDEHPMVNRSSVHLILGRRPDMAVTGVNWLMDSTLYIRSDFQTHLHLLLGSQVDENESTFAATGASDKGSRQQPGYFRKQE